MDFRQLETFVEVTKLKSFSKAADKLFITQPTVTNHIQNLEKELDTLLIDRFGKNIALTEAGHLLYKYAINILNSCEMAKFDLSAFQGKIKGHLHIYASSVPRKHLLPIIIKEFLSVYPEVSFEIEDKDSKKVVKAILDGETDFGIIGAKYDFNNLNYIELMEDRLIMIAPNNHNFPYENYSYIDKDIIFNNSLILREEGSGTRNIIESSFLKNDLPINKAKTIAYIQDTETIKELVSLGVGISFISEKSVEIDVKLGKYKAFYIKNLDFKRTFYFVFHKSRQLSPLSETFKAHLIKHIKDCL